MDEDRRPVANWCASVAMIAALMLAFSGCVPYPNGKKPKPIEPDQPLTGTYTEQSHAAAVKYIHRLGDAADAIAAEIKSKKITDNATAFDRFYKLSDEAKKEFNREQSVAAKNRNPPKGPVDEDAWTEAGKGFHKVK